MKMWSRLTIRLRLTVWYTVTLGLILIVFSAAIYFLLQKALFERLDTQLQEDFELAVEILDIDESGSIRVRSDRSFDDSIFRHERRWLEVFEPDTDQLLYPESSSLGPLTVSCSAGISNHYSIDNLRVFCTPLSLGLKHLIIRVARSEEPVYYETKELLVILGFFVPLGLFASSIGGSFLARRALKPVDDIVEQAERISADRMDLRVEVANQDDELGRLAAVINSTFERLEKSFANMKRFTSDASHELRTPLTSIRTVAEVALRKHLTAEESREVIASILEDAIGMSNLVESLIMLSRIDAQQVELELTAVKLQDLIGETLHPLNRAAGEKSIQIITKFQPDKTVYCDKPLMIQALRNLVQNAIKFSKAGDSVSIKTTAADSHERIAIKDSGIGISEEDLPHIFERFYRADKSRSRFQGGVGLGLSLVKWIIESHCGTIQVASEPGLGTTFTILLPRIQQEKS